MKTILLSFVLVVAIGCSNLREVQQVDMVEARVIRIDTVFRHPDHLKKLTWQDRDEVRYVSFVALYNNQYPVGSRMLVMKKR